MKRIFDEEMGVLEYCFGYRLGQTKQNSMSFQIPCQPHISTVFTGGGGGATGHISISWYSLNIQTVHVVNRGHFSDFPVLNPSIKPGYDLIHVVNSTYTVN